MATRPIADGLFTDGPDPRLIGGRHRQTARVVFPFPDGPDAALHDRVELSPHGTLWSWTIQRFRPKSPPYQGPAAFEPYAVGYVALAGETIVASRLTGVAFDAIRIGMKLRLTVIPFTQGAGGEVVTYAFAPDEAVLP